jgi:hypothetical protein
MVEESVESNSLERKFILDLSASALWSNLESLVETRIKRNPRLSDEDKKNLLNETKISILSSLKLRLDLARSSEREGDLKMDIIAFTETLDDNLRDFVDFRNGERNRIQEVLEVKKKICESYAARNERIFYACMALFALIAGFLLHTFLKP